eukprot:gb/GEZN01005559.1/.p1 GENE.gb/GEZN01005559.1/~~gb/GEZN01005559.1/.p1  ORF type:complete len:392 (-),score=89.00 gb/GEZN01005559.1/:580-1755(-)
MDRMMLSAALVTTTVGGLCLYFVWHAALAQKLSSSASFFLSSSSSCSASVKHHSSSSSLSSFSSTHSSLSSPSSSSCASSIPLPSSSPSSSSPLTISSPSSSESVPCSASPPSSPSLPLTNRTGPVQQSASSLSHTSFSEPSPFFFGSSDAEETFCLLEDGGECVVRYGISLSLMAECSKIINQTGFGVDPTADWKRQQRRGRGRLLYVLLQSGMAPAAAARLLVFPGVSAAGRVAPARLVIQYLTTQKKLRGLGHGKRLVQFTIALAASQCMDLLVASTEEAAPFWINRGFVLEQDRHLVDRYNEFSDALLLKLSSNQAGSQKDLHVSESFLRWVLSDAAGAEDKHFDEESDEEINDESDEEEERSHSEDGDEIFQQALAASLDFHCSER